MACIKVAHLTVFLAIVVTAFDARAVEFPKNEYSGGSLSLTHWLVLGPVLAFDDQRYMGPSGGKEWLGPELFRRDRESDEVVDKQRFIAMLSTQSESVDINDLPAPRVERSRGREIIDFHDLFSRPYAATNPQATCYAACTIQTNENVTAYLLTASAGGLRIWLNGKPVYTDGAYRRLDPFSESNPIELAAGENFLVIKIRATRHNWGMSAQLEPSVPEAIARGVKAQKRMESQILAKSLIKEGESLNLAVRGAPPMWDTDVIITDLNAHVLQRLRSAGSVVSLKQVPAGLYRLAFELNGNTYSEVFCIGSPLDLKTAFEFRLAPFLSDDRINAHISGAFRQLALLFQPPTEPRYRLHERDWEQRVIFSLVECHQMLSALEAHIDPSKDSKGIHLRGLRSQLDGQLQHYRIFVPSSYSRASKPLQLILFLTTPVETLRPFVESAHVTAHGDASHLAWMAEQLGLGIVWVGYRNQPAGHPGEFAHLEEVLTSVAKDYRIDPEKIYLLGVCEAGMVAAMAAVRWPERFAGVGFLHPEFAKAKNDPFEPRAFGGMPDYRLWMNQNNPTEQFLKLKDVPAYLIHEGSSLGHGDLRISLAFKRACEAAGFPLRFERSYQTVGSSDGAYESLFSWFTSLSRTNASDRRVESYFVGSITTALAEPFCVVVGTGGTEQERNAVKKIAEEFQNVWVKTHFGQCRIALDTDAIAESGEMNRVLIGNSRTNAVWRDLSAKLPVRFSQSTLTVQDREWSGQNLGLQALLTDPNHPSRRIVLIGADDIVNAKFGTQRLSIDGWFEYAVWSASGETASLLDAGYFRHQSLEKRAGSD